MGRAETKAATRKVAARKEKYMETNTGSTIKVRASSLGELFDCPCRWEAKHLRGLRCPTGAGALLGTAVHASTAVYDQAVLDGSGITADEAAGAAVDAIHKPDCDVDWGEDQPQETERIALALHSMYCGEIAPRQDYLAVEIECPALEISDIGITLTGTTDRVRRTPVGYGISDLKTGKSVVGADGVVKTAGHALQMAVYELLAETALGEPMAAPAEIIGLQVAKTSRGQRVGVGEISGARGLLVGDEESPGALRLAADMLRAGTFYGNPRSQICGEKYCPIYNICRWRK